MKEITLKITFLDDKDYCEFMDDMGCADVKEEIRIPYKCKVKWVKE